jgi:hypothetical protein
VNTPPVTATIQITPSKLVNAINNISANISSFDSGFKPDPIAYNISLTAKTTQKCCDDCCNAGYEKTVTFSGAIKGGGGGEFPLTGIPHIASINATLNASFSLTLGGGGFTPACATEQQYCGSLTLSGTIGGGFSGSVGGSKILYCSVTIQGDVSGSGQACVDSTTYTLTSASVTGCLGPISVEGNAKLFSGLSFKINYQLVPKFCSP